MGITISKPLLAILCSARDIRPIDHIVSKSSHMDSWTVSVDSRNTLADRVHRTQEITSPRVRTIFS